MDGKYTPTLSTWSLAAARTLSRPRYPVRLWAAHDLGMRVRRGHLWAGLKGEREQKGPACRNAPDCTSAVLSGWYPGRGAMWAGSPELPLPAAFFWSRKLTCGDVEFGH